MIYLKNTTESQVLMIPRSGASTSGDLALRLRNTTDLREMEISVIDLNVSGMYYNLAITLPEGIASGEYEYCLVNDCELAKGILVLGTESNPYQYAEEITYTQYESD